MGCRKRLATELQWIQNNPSKDWSVVPRTSTEEGEDPCAWSVELKPTEGPFAGLVVTGLLEFPADYPFKPPKQFVFQTRIFHPVFLPNPCSRDERMELAKLIADLKKEAIPIPANLIEFEVRNLQGDRFAIEMCGNETVIRFMEKMEIEHDLLIVGTRYILKGKQLFEDYEKLSILDRNRSLLDCGITQGTTIHAILRSGCYHAEDCTCPACDRRLRDQWSPALTGTRIMLDSVFSALQHPKPGFGHNYFAAELLKLSPALFTQMARKYASG